MHKTLWFAVAMSLQVPSLYCQANPNNTMGLAQQQRNVRDGSYRNAILHKIDSLLESKYVLPEKATKNAEEFKKCIPRVLVNPVQPPQNLLER